MYEIVCCQRAFSSDYSVSEYSSGSQILEFPSDLEVFQVDGFEAAVRDTVSRALNVDPAKRPTAPVLNYDFVVAFSEFPSAKDTLIDSSTKSKPITSSGSSADLLARLTELTVEGTPPPENSIGKTVSAIEEAHKTENNILPASSFTIESHPSPYVEVEMTVDYPLNLLIRILPFASKIYEQLERLGEDASGFSFGYDILPEGARLENPADAEVFTGN